MFKVAIQSATSAEALIKACEKLSIPYEIFHLSLDGEITGTILKDSSNVILPFGSVELLQLYRKNKLPANWKIFYTDYSFSQLESSTNNSLLSYLYLNNDAYFYDFSKCANSFYIEDRFVKSDLKLFNGQILDSGTSLKELFSSDIAGQVLFSPVKSILDEFRVFVVDGEVVSKCLYKRNGNLVGGFSYKFSWLERFIINNLACIYKPDTAYVVDICTTKGILGKKWHILGYEALQCSKFYTCDIVQVLHALIWYWDAIH